MVEMPGIKEPERVRKLLQGSANLEFWETFFTTEAAPYLVQLDSKLAAVAGNDNSESTEVAEATEETAEVEAAPAEEAAAADSSAAADEAGLAAIAKGATSDDAAAKANAAADAAALKAHPLLARLQVLNQNYGCVVGYANKRDMNAIDSLLQTPEAKAVLPAELKLLWGVKGVYITFSSPDRR